MREISGRAELDLKNPRMGLELSRNVVLLLICPHQDTLVKLSN